MSATRPREGARGDPRDDGDPGACERAAEPHAPERWLTLSVRSLSEEAGELLTEALLDLGGRAVQEESGRLVTHIPEPPDLDAFLAWAVPALREAAGGEDPGVETRWQAQDDWAEVWKRGLAPRRITRRLVVTPSWCEPETRPGDRVVTVDPGMAFGSAEHGTTRGCLRLMDAVVRGGERILDVGAGSGILSIAAALLGAVDVLALEGDPWAVGPARDNVRANGVADRVDVRQAWASTAMLEGLEPRDGVMANLESGILLPLLSGLVSAVRPGGWLILGGILADEWVEVRAQVEGRGLTCVAVDADGEWRSARFHRPGPVR